MSCPWSYVPATNMIMARPAISSSASLGIVVSYHTCSATNNNLHLGEMGTGDENESGKDYER